MLHVSIWTDDHVRRIGANFDQAPPILGSDVSPVAGGVNVWDAWPIQHRDGSPFTLDGAVQLWMALAAPPSPDPDQRHGQARIHLLRREGGNWHDLGPAMPDGFSPGSREWSGSAIIDAAGSCVTLYFTAAGRRGESELTFEQRIFAACATVSADGRCSDWRDLREIVAINPAWYMPTTGGGKIGTIKAFRDPAYFHDPRSGVHYLYFAASLAGSASPFNGAVGMATAAPERPDDWTLAPPVMAADGLNNELERPHVLMHGDRYYLFWSTQRHVFDPGGPAGPTGLYGMVSDRPDGGWRPLNGSGLVLANPAHAPSQAYSWMVLPDLNVTSFIDDWGDNRERRFGGTFAPFLKLVLNGDRAGLQVANEHAG